MYDNRIFSTNCGDIRFLLYVLSHCLHLFILIKDHGYSCLKINKKLLSSKNSLVWKRLLKVIYYNLPAMGREIFI